MVNDIKYKYRPPFKYFIQGFLYLSISIIFLLAMLKNVKIIILILLIIFFVTTFISGFLYLILYLKNILANKTICLTLNEIIIPSRWKNKSIHVKYSDIVDCFSYITYTELLEICTKEEIYLIEKNWFSDKNDFYNLIDALKEKCQLE